jgi:hypothetical protein
VVTETNTAWQNFINILEYEFKNRFEEFSKYKDILESKLNSDKINLQSIKPDIKNFADATLYTYQLAKYFSIEKKRAWDESYELDDFYTDPNTGYHTHYYPDAYEQIVKPYNDLRNFLTKKPYSEEKWKLNFECSYLLGGWSSEFGTFSSLLFKKDETYYLGIINGTKLSEEKRNLLKEDINNQNICLKMVYDFQKPDNKNVPRLFIRSKGDNFSPAVEELNLPIQDVLDIYDKGLFKTENKDNPTFKESLRKMIDYFKLGFSKHKSYKDFSFKWKPSSEYQNIADFYQDTIRSCYTISWEEINFDELQKLTVSGDIYLFKIHNKDFSEASKGVKNLHTMYFQGLFLENNIDNEEGIILKLSGGGEIFFRPKTEKKDLGQKRDLQGKLVVKNKRYSEDKMFLHFPIELNYAQGTTLRFNSKINNFLANNSDINIIGVDRGEKHLAYYSVIDQKGNIIESDTLNTIRGGKQENIDYAKKLEEVAGDREQARKDWESVEGIKNLKKGYISQVVRKLADLAIKHNAIIVFEDLNMRFKQIRGGIEKSVYQQLEKALIDKLNFLVDKNEIDPNKAGHLLKAYQLAAPFESFKDMGKQTGIIFYTQASYTSRIDPITGWRPNLYLKYKNATQSKSELLKFDRIEYKEDRFEFTYDLKNFVNLKEFPNKTKWTICSNVERFRWDKKLNNNKGGYIHYENLTHYLIKLFEENNIEYKNQNIVNQINNLEEKGNEKFFKDIIFYINLICQIRNTNKDLSGNENDFILSPVEPFFDSRKNNSENLPKNGDDNGAYNIARKGIIILEKVSKYAKLNGDTEKMKWNDLYISHIDWDNFATKN